MSSRHTLNSEILERKSLVNAEQIEIKIIEIPTWLCTVLCWSDQIERLLLRTVEEPRLVESSHCLASTNYTDSSSNRMGIRCQHCHCSYNFRQCIRCSCVALRDFDDSNCHEFFADESDLQSKRGESMREWQWRHSLLVICQNRAFSQSFQTDDHPSRWIHSTSSRFEMICMPVVVCREQPYIPWRDHCHKCKAFEERNNIKKRVIFFIENKVKVEHSVEAIEMRAYLQMSGPGT